ncbi:MAG: AraC family transcriptional regulator [Lachnospiraceae bacterium]|nr:AraC family transcriptional regulator [Lachnospiraceae bacterium]
MDEQLMKKMQMITSEEQAYLDEDPQVKKEIYTKKNEFEVDSQLFLREGKLITVRRHSRFVEFPLHKHNYIEIVYVFAGELTHYIDGKEIRMQQGDMLLLNQHVEHGVKCAGAGDIGINFIVLPEFFDIPLQMMNKENIIANFLVGTLKQNNAVPQYLNFRLQDQNAISNLMENMIISIMDGNSNEDVINQYSMGLVFLYLINHIDRLSGDSSQSYEDIVIQATTKYIDSHYRTASLSHIAGDFNLSLPALSRMIKKCTGHTFQELLMRKRFQKAVVFLMETELPVEEIAINVGYENQSYFYRQFKARYEMTPNQYRIIHKNDDQIEI